MFESGHTFRPVCAGLLLLVSGLPGCAHKAEAEHARRAAETSGELTTKELLNTSVESVDVEARTLTLRDASGRPFTIITGDATALDDLRPSDPVRLVYQEAVSFRLQDAPSDQKAAPPATVQRFETKRLPDNDGVEFARRVDTVVEIVSISPHGSAATFRVPDGNLRAVAIDDLRNRAQVKRLRPGDAVAVVYTEKLLLERE
jgi:hypothetical protein